MNNPTAETIDRLADRLARPALNFVFNRWPLIKDHPYHDPYGEERCTVVVDEATEGVSRCNRPPWEHFKFCACVERCEGDCW